jgi:DNA-binding response OmpR family regulator
VAQAVCCAGYHGTRTASLTRRETSVLQALMATPGHPLRRQELGERVWGQDYVGKSNVLDATVTRLSQKLLHAGASQRYVRNRSRDSPVRRSVPYTHCEESESSR